MKFEDVARVHPQVVMRSELLAAGYSDDQIRADCRTGLLRSLVRGAFATVDGIGAVTPTDHHRLVAIAAARRAPSLVVSHVSAAALHHLPLYRANLDAVHLTRHGTGGSRKRGAVHVHTAALPEKDVATVEGIRLTSVARTLVDLARTTPFQTAVVASDHALHTAGASVGQAGRALADARHRPGAGAARRALLFADGRAESPGESLLRIVMHSAGLPEPDLQFDVFSPAGLLLGRADIGYTSCGVIVEFDGAVKYGKYRLQGESPEGALMREKKREDGLREQGWLVVRVVWSELSRRAELVGRIESALRLGRTVAANCGISGFARQRPTVKIASA